MSSPLIEFPLPAWPPEVFPFEPPHGYFRRLAACNHQYSARTLAEYVGVNGRNVVPEEMLGFCESFPVRNKHFLADANPRFEADRVVLNGQSFSRVWDHSLLRPRVCLGCLDEQNYYRNWFDLTVLRCCPIHRQPLQQSSAGERMQWWQPTLRPLGCASVDEESEFQSVAWERYALGRMGITRGDKVALLDAEPMRDIVQVAVQLGRAVKSGAVASAPQSRSSRAELAAKGYNVLADGEEGLVQFFLGLAQTNGYSKDERSLQFGMAKAFGWIAAAAADIDSALGGKVRQSLEGAARELGIYSRKGRSAAVHASERHLTLNELAPVIGLTPAKTREAAIRLGLISPGSPRSRYHAFSPVMVKTLRHAVTTSVTRAEAAERLGLSAAEFGKFASEAGLAPLARIGGPGPKDDRFLISDLDQILLHCRSQATLQGGEGVSFTSFCSLSRRSAHGVALAIFRGESRPIGWNHQQAGFAGAVLAAPLASTSKPMAHILERGRRVSLRAGVSRAEAAGILGTNVGGIRGLIAEKHIRTIDDQSGVHPWVDRTSLMRFHQQFAPARLYAEVKGVHPQRIGAVLASAGVMPLKGERLGSYLWVERQSVIDAFGEDWDLLKVDPIAEAFWRSLRAKLATERSPNRLVGGAGDSGRLRTGQGIVVAELTVFPRSKTVELVASGDQRKTPRRFERLSESVTALQAAWPSLIERSDTKAGIVKLVGRFRVADPDSPQWLESISQIHEIATMLRILLRPSKSEVQFSVSQPVPSPVFSGGKSPSHVSRSPITH